MNKGFSKNESLKVKGIAVLMLLFHHLFYSADRIASSGMKFMIIPQDYVQALAVMARICVWMFVFVSAYGLSVQYVQHGYRDSKWKFITKSWISLMKSFWFVYVIVFVLLLLSASQGIAKYDGKIYNALLDIFCWSDFFGTPSLSGVWWYMCMAQVLVFIIPAVNIMCEKMGWSSMLVGFIALQYVSDGIKSSNGGRYSNYFLVVVLAVLFARNHVFEKILSKRVRGTAKVYKGILLAVITVVLLVFKYKFTSYDLWQFNSFLSAIITALICILSCKYIKFKPLEALFIHLGIHSGNMFMFHAVLYTYYPKIVFWSGNAVLSYLTLLVLAVVFSVIVEFVKNKMHYNDLFKKLTEKLQNLNIPEEVE